MCTWFFVRWRMWIRPVVMIFYCMVILVVLPLCSIKYQQSGATPYMQAWFSGGFFVLMALPITFWEITQHLVHYNKPFLQKHIIRILWMVPIYALNAWLALTFPKSGIYLDTCRECYEAYVIYNFMVFLLNFLYYEMDLDTYLDSKPPVKHFFPLCCLTPCLGGRHFIQACKHGILQYTVLRPLTTVTALFCELLGIYGEGEFSGKYAFPYIVAINNVSQFVAMYSLVLFYKAYREELSPMKPVGKFLCIKAVVFFSFFQAVILALLVYFGVITESFASPGTDVAEVSRSLQDFLICVEMFMASVAHYFAFSYKPYVDMAAEQIPCCMSFMAMWDVSDVTQDVSEHIRHVGKRVKMSVSGRNLAGSAEEKQLLVNSSVHELEQPVTGKSYYNSLTYGPNLSQQEALPNYVHLDEPEDCAKAVKL